MFGILKAMCPSTPANKPTRTPSREHGQDRRRNRGEGGDKAGCSAPCAATGEMAVQRLRHLHRASIRAGRPCKPRSSPRQPGIRFSGMSWPGTHHGPPNRDGTSSTTGLVRRAVRQVTPAARTSRNSFRGCHRSFPEPARWTPRPVGGAPSRSAERLCRSGMTSRPALHDRFVDRAALPALPPCLSPRGRSSWSEGRRQVCVRNRTVQDTR